MIIGTLDEMVRSHGYMQSLQDRELWPKLKNRAWKDYNWWWFSPGIKLLDNTGIIGDVSYLGIFHHDGKDESAIYDSKPGVYWERFTSSKKRYAWEYPVPNGFQVCYTTSPDKTQSGLLKAVRVSQLDYEVKE